MQTESRWIPHHPDEVAKWLESCPADWWIAGGWAIDLFIGKQNREHSDLDIGCYREDLDHIIDHLPGWQFCAAINKSLREIKHSSELKPEEFGIWARPEGQTKWSMEILLERSRDEFWMYRRDNRITYPKKDLVVRTEQHNCITPAVQLLYKSKALREKDQTDYENVIDQLSSEDFSWLSDSLRTVYGEHPWI